MVIGASVILIFKSFQDKESFLRNKSIKIFLILSFLLSLIAFFFTGTRGCYFGFLMGLVCFAVLSLIFLRQENKKLVFISSGFLLLTFIFISLLFLFANNKFIRTNPYLSRITDIREFASLSSIQERILNWEIVMKGFKERPIFGWGPENYGFVFNKFYDYRVGLSEPWFDKSHNQFLEALITGGIFLFSLYLFWIFSVFYLIRKIFLKEKILGIILASIYSAYLFQDIFLFDTFPMYLTLFFFLAYLSSEYNFYYKLKSAKENDLKREDVKETFFAKPIIVLICFLLFWTTVWMPYRASAFAISSILSAKKFDFKQLKNNFERSISYDTPFSFMPVRKRVSWQTLPVFIYLEKGGAISEEQKRDLKEFYDLLIKELQEAKNRHPADPQIYYVIGVM